MLKITEQLRKPMKIKKVILLSFMLLITLLFLTSCDDSAPADDNTANVPTYTGMTVTNEAPITSNEASVNSYATFCSYIEHSAPQLLANKNKPLKDVVEEHFGIKVGESSYYANPGDDIYITITFDNPDAYEILSFTLNGEKYSSYMFEEGSDMENVILKVNVGDTSGLISYTIDAIKYVDKDKIKDVKIGGDRTLKIGIYNENQPTATITEFLFNSSSVSFKTNVKDSEQLISSVDGKIYAILYDGENVISKKEITVEESENITFDGLTALTEYIVAVVAVFDAYDGDGVVPHVLAEKSCLTKISISAENISVIEDEVSFEIHQSSSTATLIKIEIVDMLGNTVAESNGAVTSFKNLPGGKLSINISYSYEENGEIVTDTSVTPFVCTKGMLPIIGEISAHYDPNMVMLPPPISTWTAGHFGVDIVPTTENKEVYSITDGTVTQVIKPVYDSITFMHVVGIVEILDADGMYHLYKLVNSEGLAIGDSVKAGDLLGVLFDIPNNDMTLELHLHYECYTKDGDVKNYVVPEFDNEPREISELERLEKIALSEEMLVSGKLNISGKHGETVTYTTSFDFTYDDERVSMYVIGGENQYVRLEKLDDGQYAIICNFENIVEPQTVSLAYFIYVSNSQIRYCDSITLTLTPTE